MARLTHLALSLLACAFGLAAGCSNLLIPAGSSEDGSTIITYSTDNPARFGDVVRWPAEEHKEGALREIYDFDSGKRLGAIPQPSATYNVISNTNEHQLSIGETTFGGLEILDGSNGGPDFGPGHVKAICADKFGCLDYGSLIYVTLQRARTAREAIALMDKLMQTYGYASSGESFSIADPAEVWIMEIIGKGNFSRGAVWVATRIPDGHVSAHSNQARTRTFPWDDPSNVLYSKDVADFARSIGVYNGSDTDFSFSDVYDPVTFEGARFCEARVFSFFQKVASPEEDMDQYLDYAKGFNLRKRMPLHVKVKRRISVNESMWHMRDHYEGLWLDPSQDVGAGRWKSPYRLGEPMTWTYKGASYVNERFIGTNIAAMNIVANQRPRHRYGVLWFGVDDSTFSLHVPLYGVTSRLPASWDGANCTGRAACREAFGLPGTVRSFSMKAMHWVGQLVANFAYSRYDVVGPVVQQKLAELESQLFKEVATMDGQLTKMEETEATEAATDFSFQWAEMLHAKWLDFYGELFMTYVDGFRTVPNPKNSLGGCDKEKVEIGEDWKRRVVEETGRRYEVPAGLMDASISRSKSKLQLLGLDGPRQSSLEEAHEAAAQRATLLV